MEEECTLSRCRHSKGFPRRDESLKMHLRPKGGPCKNVKAMASCVQALTRYCPRLLRISHSVYHDYLSHGVSPGGKDCRPSLQYRWLVLNSVASGSVRVHPLLLYTQFLLFWDSVLCSLDCLQTHNVAQVGLASWSSSSSLVVRLHNDPPCLVQSRAFQPSILFPEPAYTHTVSPLLFSLTSIE